MLIPGSNISFTFFRFLFIISLINLITASNAQVSVNASGGDGQSDAGSISFSIGQLVDEFFTSKEGSSSEGVQQPFEFFTSGVAVAPMASVTAVVKPNPFNDFIIVQANLLTDSPFHFSISDLNGRIYKQGLISGPNTIIELAQLPVGIYFISFQHEDLHIHPHILLKPH